MKTLIIVILLLIAYPLHAECRSAPGAVFCPEIWKPVQPYGATQKRNDNDLWVKALIAAQIAQGHYQRAYPPFPSSPEDYVGRALQDWQDEERFERMLDIVRGHRRY